MPRNSLIAAGLTLVILLPVCVWIADAVPGAMIA